MNRRRVPLLAAGLALLGSQAGHALSYWMRFGAAAWPLESSGAHAYFPLVLKTGAGAVAAAAIVGLVAVGLARTLAGRRVAGSETLPFVPTLATLFTAQLAVFALQESIESAAAGSTGLTAASVVMWGTLGQLPVAALAALALRWLALEVAPSIAFVVTRPAAPRCGPARLEPATLVVGVEPAVLRSRTAGARVSDRAPPARSFA